MTEDFNSNTVVIQQLATIALDMREMRKSMSEYVRDTRDNTVKLERVLTQVEQLSKMPQEFESVASRVAEGDMRLGALESAVKVIPTCVSEKHEERIRKMENAYFRMTVIGLMSIGVMEILFHLFDLWTRHAL